jgi:hypothetical protein
VRSLGGPERTLPVVRVHMDDIDSVIQRKGYPEAEAGRSRIAGRHSPGRSAPGRRMEDLSTSHWGRARALSIIGFECQPERSPADG